MPNFVLIIGPQAVGKMTVGQELAKITGYKLFYNHMTIEMVRLIFDYDKNVFHKMNELIRYEVFKEFAKSNEKGIIFTGCFDFGDRFEEENKEKEGIDDLDIGFKVFKLDSSNINRWDSSYNQDLEHNLLFSIDNIKKIKVYKVEI